MEVMIMFWKINNEHVDRMLIERLARDIQHNNEHDRIIGYLHTLNSGWYVVVFSSDTGHVFITNHIDNSYWVWWQDRLRALFNSDNDYEWVSSNV